MDGTQHTRWADGSETWSGENWVIHWGGPYAQAFSWAAYRTEDDRFDDRPLAEGFLDLVHFSEGLAAAWAAIYDTLAN